MKKIKWILCILTVIISLGMIFVLPDTVPVHFDINGNVDRWGGKAELLMMPIILIVCAIGFEPLKKSYVKKAEMCEDEKEKAGHLSNAKVLNITGIITLILFFVINTITLYTVYIAVYPDKNLPYIDTFKIIGILMGITFIALGNYMPKTRNNRHIGFRLSWTRYNDTTWNKSNRFASYVMMIAGVIAVISSIFINGVLSSFISVVAIIAALPIITIYAYMVYHSEKKKEQ